MWHDGFRCLVYDIRTGSGSIACRSVDIFRQLSRICKATYCENLPDVLSLCCPRTGPDNALHLTDCMARGVLLCGTNPPNFYLGDRHALAVYASTDAAGKPHCNKLEKGTDLRLVQLFASSFLAAFHPISPALRTYSSNTGASDTHTVDGPNLRRGFVAGAAILRDQVQRYQHCEHHVRLLRPHCMLSLWHPKAQPCHAGTQSYLTLILMQYINTARECYEAFVVYSFLVFLARYVAITMPTRRNSNSLSHSSSIRQVFCVVVFVTHTSFGYTVSE
jgi:hypothetical protein